ncbi:hypothetical protein D3C73_935090 [compost metagenome]
MHGADIDAEAARTFRIVAEGIKLAADRGAGHHEPGGDAAEDHHHDRQCQFQPGAVTHLTFVEDDTRGQPFRQVVDRYALGEEHQQAEEDIEGRDGRDYRDDLQLVDKRRIDQPKADADRASDDEAFGPIAPAQIRNCQRGHILHHGGRHRE